MAIYFVDEKGNKVDPNTVAPLTPVFTVNDEEKGHEDFLKQLRGELQTDGVMRLTPDPQKPDAPNQGALPKGK